MKVLLVLFFLTLNAVNHPSLAGEKLEGWFYPLDDFPLAAHPVHPAGRALVIPEHGRSLEPPQSAATPVRATITVLTDEEAREQEAVDKKARELLLEVQRERDFKGNKEGKIC